MQRRPRRLLILASALALSCGGSARPPPTTAEATPKGEDDVVSPPTGACTTDMDAADRYFALDAPGRNVVLVGLDAKGRAAFLSAARAGVVVVRAEETQRGIDVRLVACTRPAQYVMTPCPSPFAPMRMFRRGEDISRRDVAWGATLDGPAKFYTALTVSGAHRSDRSIRWFGDLAGKTGAEDLRPASSRRSEWSMPPLDVAELRGPECSAATHWVRRLGQGALRLTYDEYERKGVVVSSTQPDDLDAIEIVPLERRGCPRTLSLAGGACAMPPPASVALPRYITSPRPGCSVPVDGQPTEQAAQAFRSFESRRWAEAAPLLERVALGSTGDDEGNQQRALHLFGAALHMAGDIGRSNAVMTAIARAPCNAFARHAQAWLTLGTRLLP